MSSARTPPTRPASLIRLLTWPLCAALLLTGLVGVGFAEYLIRQRLTADFDAGLHARINFLTSVTRFEIPDPDEGQFQPWVEFDFDPEGAIEFLPGPDAAYFQIWQDSNELGRSRSLSAELTLHPAPLNDLILALDQPVYVDGALPDGRSGRYARMRFLPQFDEDWGQIIEDRPKRFAHEYPDKVRPQAFVDVAISRAGLDRTLADMRMLLFGSLSAMLLVLWLLVPPIARWALRPLRELNAQLGDIDPKRLDTRINAQGLPVELLPVADAANSLLIKLQQAFDNERLFSRNVAHELRTPIAELRSLGEVGSQWPDDPKANARFFADVLKISARMERMVSNLLMMARQESGQLPLLWEPLDLISEVRLLQSRHNGEGLPLRGPEQLWVRSDRSCLEIIVGNLIANALAHGSGEGECWIRVEADSAHARLTVANPAADLQPADLTHLFDRFWRKDLARTGGSHVGLGLSLVRALVALMGWQVEARLDDGHFRVCVCQIALTDPGVAGNN